MRSASMIGTLLMCSVAGVEGYAAVAPDHPNVVIFFCDDLGYGDLACFGNPTISTPNLDRMCREGQKWTSFYVAASVCTPSRAGLMTGRLPIRTGMCSDTRRVLFPDSAGGLQPDELTIAEVLKGAGYATACVGKWHLGHLPTYLPTRQGFDSYLGIPYSNDMDRVADSPKGREAFLHPKYDYWNVPLMRNDQIIERPTDQNTITKRYTEEAVRFIRENKDRPFFLYLPHTMSHVPLFASEAFKGKSLRGLFGDVVEELDWSMGQVLDTLRDLRLDERTLVVFTSDNGPWLIFNELGGSAGCLRDGKGSTWEGGMREPTLFWWPGTIRPGVVRDVGSTLDLLPTCAKLAGAKLPEGLVLDGMDISPALLGTGPSPRDVMFFYRGTRLYAVRKGPYKAHFITQDAYGSGKPETHDPPLLYHLGHDPSEKFNVAAEHPDVVAEIRKLADAHLAAMKPGKPQLDATIRAGR
jgi:arylsulfatase A